MAEEKFYFDSLQDTATITEFLQALTDGFAKGQINLTTNGDSIDLCPKGLLSFMVKAKKKRGASKLNIKISWKDPGESEDCDSAVLSVE